MAKRKRETKEQGLSAQEKPLGSKKQKKSHEKTVEPQGLGDASAETLPAETVSPKSKTTDGATKLARQIAKRERRKLQRMQNQESRGGSKGGKAGLKQEDGIQKLSEKVELSTSKETITIDEAGLKPKNESGTRNAAHKLTKKERRMSERMGKEPKAQKTEENGEDNGQPSIEREVSKKEKRKEERQRKKARRLSEKPAAALADGESPTLKEPKKTGKELEAKSDEEVVPKKRKGKKGKRQEDTGKQVKDSAWKVSDPIGGHMLDIDPVFSPDEKFLLVAYDTSIAVYSTTTSLKVRQLRSKKAERISALALSASVPSQIYLTTTTGTIEKWDWTEGMKLGSWKLSSSIYFLATSKQGVDGGGGFTSMRTMIAGDAEDKAQSARDLVYTVDKKDHGPWILSAHRLMGEKEIAKTEVVTLLKNKEPISSFNVAEDGQVIVATSERKLIVGTSNTPGPANLRELSYVWRILECPEWISSVDVRMRPVGNLDKQAKTKTLLRDSLDIAVGGLKGSIHVYEDLLKKLFRREQAASKNNVVEDITSRRLHWHRNSVLAVKWSLDGHYIISGGQETVLVLWQLETERKQNLPHLGAPIESIVVSPTGSSYGIRLADNSAMILSTSELRPTFSIAGVQIPSAGKIDRVRLPFVPTVDAPSEGTKRGQGSRLPACISPSAGSHLLLAVPPSVSSRQATYTTRNASYLQTFDLGGGHQISRQALARTNITTLNMGPESNTIKEPNVTRIQTSFDGQWLATVDEWMPPKRDVEPLAFDQDRVAEEQIFRREIHLKFWSWNDNTKVWELVSRVDNPHASTGGNPYNQGRVLDLASDPSAVGFATIGEDGTIKTWKPAIRRRNGLEVRSKDGKSLGTWHCKHTVPVDSAKPIPPTSILDAKLAYSQDGTILAAGLQSSTPCPIHIIDAYIGEVKSIQTGLYSGPLFGLGIVSKYLITLSHELCVWDLITDHRQYGIQLHSYGLSPAKQLSMTHLTTDAENGLFAVAVPEIGTGANAATAMKSRIAVFDPANPAPLLLTPLPNPVKHLLSATKKKAFHIIDFAAEIMTVAPRQIVSSLPTALVAETEQASRGLRDIFGTGQTTKAVENGVDKPVGLLPSRFDSITRDTPVHEDDAVVVSQDKLAEVFDVGPAYAMPPVTDLFEQVASLYNGRAS